LEVNAHSDAAKGKSAREIVPASIASADGVTIDWDEVQKAIGENAGLPRLVGGRQGSKSWHHLDMIF
jgi:L,D-transpeptidase ErfK/SrfK